MIQTLTHAVVRIVLAILLVGVLSISASVPSSPVFGLFATLAEDDDEGGDDDDDDDGGDDDDDGGGDDDGDDDDGNDDDDDGGSTHAVTLVEAPVTATDSLGVDVSCEGSPDSGHSTCAFIPVGTDGAALDLLVPVQGICSDVTGGDYETDPLDTDDDDDTAFYPARDGETEVILILNGDVSTSGTTIYWIETGDGRQPAAGLGLTCEIPAASTPDPSASPVAAASTGSITVQAYRSDIAAPPDAATFDWYGECVDPGDDLAFDLFFGDGETPDETVISDDDGLTTFSSLNPGAYRLEESGGDWCHAESDSVDASGAVVVEEGTDSRVWIFQCAHGDEVK